MADESTTFHGWAAHEATTVLKPFSYHPRPIGPLDVEVSITHCGICYSDVHTFTGGWKGVQFPVLPGHEIVGVVTKVGADVTRVAIGDRAGVGPHCLTCLTCEACTSKQDNLCNKLTWTYNDQYKDDRGGTTYGGYADNVRAHEQFVFKIPEALSSAEVAPLLCAGLTTFAPIMRLGIKAGSKVGVVGIGGLGHLAVQWCAKLGAHVTAISHTDSKKEHAEKLGAQGFLVSRDREEVKRASRSLDVILCSSISKNAQLPMYLSMLKNGGTFVLMAVPETELTFPPGAIVSRQLTVSGSIVGSREDMDAMLEFAAKHDVRAWVQVMPMDQVNEAIVKVMNGEPRYRMVLENPPKQ